MQDLTESWKFSKDPQDVGYRKGAHKSTFNDGNWFTINTSQSWRDQGQQYQGNAWYRKSFTIGKREPAKRYALFFHAINGDARVYLNGSGIGSVESAGKESDNVNDLILDITDDLLEGENVIAVHITDPPYISPGIVKGVSLLVFKPLK